jgi:hypothetical protein
MILLRLLLILLPVSAATCYFPNGAIARDYLPCTNQAFSTCCLPAYTCLSNNICTFIPLNRDPDSNIDYVRGACTDSTWNSTSCPKFCNNGNPPFRDQISGSQSMSRCPGRKDDVYYCGDDNYLKVDCGKGVGVLSFAGVFFLLQNRMRNWVLMRVRSS